MLQVAEAVLRGGTTLVQYRDKTNDHARRVEEARALRNLCARYNVPLIVNDDVQLALAIDAAGVHLGEHDAAVATARTQVGPNAIIGVSCYDSLARGRELAAAGADYLAFGAFYPSPTKPNARRATLDLLHEAKAFGPPLVAIGGITPDNAQVLLDAGANYLAVISAVFGAIDPASVAQKYKKLFDADLHG